MKILSTRFNLIAGSAALMLFALCVFQAATMTALATTSNGTVAQGGDPDRPIIVGQVPNSSNDKSKAKGAHPELTIKQSLFPPADDKALRVQVANTGKVAAGAGRLVLSVGEINGVATRTKTQVKVFSSLAAGASAWLVIDASNILPNNVSLQSTSFKLNVYSTESIAGSGKTEVRHAQLDFSAATPTRAQRRRIIEGYSAEFYGGGRLESGNQDRLKNKAAQPEESRDSFYGTGVYKSTDAGANTNSQEPGDVAFNQSRGHTQSTSAQGRGRLRVKGAPDLLISEYVFGLPKDNNDVKVFVVTEGQTRQTSRSGATFALVAARFKNGGGPYYNQLLNGEKVVLVHVVNAGTQATTSCRVKLTVRKINGAAVGREKVATVPALAAGKDVWILVDATSILPNNIKLDETTFKLNVDATELLEESNEGNNEAWHNE